MSEANGSATSKNSCGITVGEPDEFGRRTIGGVVNEVEYHRDLFNPDSAAACDKFADGLRTTAPYEFVTWACRKALNLNDDQYVTEREVPFAKWVRSQILKKLNTPAGAAKDDPDRFTIHSMTSAEFDGGDYTQTYLVDGVLVKGESCVVAAGMKNMKTTIGGVGLGMSLALGEPFLGRFHVPRSVNTLFASGESGWSSLQSAGRRIAESMGYTLADATKLFWTKDLVRIGQPDHMAELRDAFKRLGIEVFILDPLYFCLPGQDAGNLLIMGPLLRSLSKLCEDSGVTLVVIHHVKKTAQNPYAPPDLTDISWSGTAEWARQWLLLARREPYIDGSGLHRLWMRLGGSAGHNSLWGVDCFEGVHPNRTWAVEVLPAEEVREAAEDEIEQRERAKLERKERATAEADERNLSKLLAVVAKLKCATQSDIRGRCTFNGRTFPRVWSMAIDGGHIIEGEKVKKPTNNQWYFTYRLSTEDTGDTPRTS